MAFREVTMQDIKEFLRLWLDGIPKKRIARLLGRDAKTVRTYLRAAQACCLSPGGNSEALTEEILAAVVSKVHPESGRPKGDGWIKCCEEREFIRGYLGRGVRLTKIRNLLLRLRGVHVSYPTLWRFAVLELGFGRKRLAIPVADCGPVEEVQLDTGWVDWLSPDASGSPPSTIRCEHRAP